jgi:hypothetical protein
MNNNCKVVDCSKASRRAGYCGAHYARLLRHGNPLAGRVAQTPAGEALNWVKNHVGHEGEDCLTWPFGKFATGYGSVTYEGKSWIASRLMCTFAHGSAPTSNHFALHLCGRGDFGCTNPRHLYWGLPSDNGADAVRHGVTVRGERQASAKFDEQSVRRIRQEVSQGRPVVAIAKEFGATTQAVYLIVSKKNWAWVE